MLFVYDQVTDHRPVVGDIRMGHTNDPVHPRLVSLKGHDRFLSLLYLAFHVQAVDDERMAGTVDSEDAQANGFAFLSVDGAGIPAIRFNCFPIRPGGFEFAGYEMDRALLPGCGCRSIVGTLSSSCSYQSHAAPEMSRAATPSFMYRRCLGRITKNEAIGTLPFR